MKFSDGYMMSSGFCTTEYVDMAVRHLKLRTGTLGIRVKIMLPHDPKGINGPKTILPGMSMCTMMVMMVHSLLMSFSRSRHRHSTKGALNTLGLTSISLCCCIACIANVIIVCAFIELVTWHATQPAVVIIKTLLCKTFAFY